MFIVIISLPGPITSLILPVFINRVCPQMDLVISLLSVSLEWVNNWAWASAQIDCGNY